MDENEGAPGQLIDFFFIPSNGIDGRIFSCQRMTWRKVLSADMEQDSWNLFNSGMTKKCHQLFRESVSKTKNAPGRVN